MADYFTPRELAILEPMIRAREARRNARKENALEKKVERAKKLNFALGVYEYSKRTGQFPEY